MTFGGQLIDVSSQEAWGLLSNAVTGRLAWDGREGLSIVPLNYVVVDQQLWLRTAPYSTWIRDMDGRPVAFEVDEIDRATHSGWSVLLRGVMHLADGMDTPPEAMTAEVWPAGSRIQHLYLAPTSVTGKQLLPS